MDKKTSSVVWESVAYQALQKIAEFYNADTGLKGLMSEERLQKRQEKILPLVEKFFAPVFFRYILTELPNLCDEQGNLDPADLNHLMSWSSELPAECRKSHL